MNFKMKIIAIAVSLACSQASHAALLDVNVNLGLLGGTATSTTAVSIGEGSYANESTVSVGRNSGKNSIGINNTFVGALAGFNAMGSYNTSVGYDSSRTITGDGNSIFGSVGLCSFLFTTPFGQTCGAGGAVVNGDSNLLLGDTQNVKVTGDRNVSAGFNAGSTGGNDNISFGTGSGPGTTIGGEIYVGNFHTAGAPIKVNETISIGTRAHSTTNQSITIGADANVKGDLRDGNINSSSIAIGAGSLVMSTTGNSSVALGTGSQVLNAGNSVALGANSVATSDNVVSVGSNLIKREIQNVADATSEYSAVNLRQVQRLISELSVSVPVIGGGGDTSVTPPTDLGDPGINIGPDYTAIGINASAAPTNVSLGTNATATGNNNVAIGNNSAVNDGDNLTVSFGNADLGITRRLTNIADGVLNSDAATVGQVNNLFNTFISNMPVGGPVLIPDYTDENGNTALGDGAGVGNTGSNNTFIGQNAGSTTGTSSNSVAVGDGAKSGNNAVALGAGSVAEDNTVSVGSVGNERQVKNVADGSSETDAVNVRQLNTVATNTASVANETRANSTAIRGLDTRINSLSRDLKEVARRAYGGTALALAMTNGSTTNPGQAQLQIGVGSFNGEHAMALSTTMANEKGTVFSLGGGFTSEGDIGIRAGVSFTWDPEWTK